MWRFRDQHSHFLEVCIHEGNRKLYIRGVLVPAALGLLLLATTLQAVENSRYTRHETELFGRRCIAPFVFRFFTSGTLGTAAICLACILQQCEYLMFAYGRGWRGSTVALMYLGLDTKFPYLGMLTDREQVTIYSASTVCLLIIVAACIGAVYFATLGVYSTLQCSAAV